MHMHSLRLVRTQSESWLENFAVKSSLFPSWLSYFKGRKKKDLKVYLFLLAQVKADPGHFSLRVCWGQTQQGTISCSVVLFPSHTEQKLGTVKSLNYESDSNNSVAVQFLTIRLILKVGSIETGTFSVLSCRFQSFFQPVYLDYS